MNKLDIENILDLIDFFSIHEGYWCIEKSEDYNLSIKYCPFVYDWVDKKYLEFYQKRVYSIERFKEECEIKILSVIDQGKSHE